MTAQNVEFSNLSAQQQQESVENVQKTVQKELENIRAADSKANFLGTGGGTIAIAAATLVGSSPDSLTNLLKGLLLVAALIMMVAVVATQIAVDPRTKGMDNKISKENLSKQMLAKNDTLFFESKYNRLLDECLYLTTHVFPTKNKWIRFSIRISWVGVSVLVVAVTGWLVSLI